MDTPGQAPEDFTAFVATHSGRVRALCSALTGNDRLVESLQRDLFTAVALHWWWLRRQPTRSRARTAASYLDRLFRREARGWRDDVRPGLADRTQVEPAQLERAGARHRADDLATVAWDQARRTRNRRRAIVAVVVVAVGCLALVSPRRSTSPPEQVTPTTPLPTAVPAGVKVVPPFPALAALPQRATALPETINVEPSGAALLTQAPVARALAIAQQELGPLIIVAPDGSTRSLNDTALLGARMLATSLSPDGARAALTTADGLLVIDLTRGTLRPVAAATQTSPALPSLVWRSARTVLVPTRSGAQEINVDTGVATNLFGLTGANVATSQGPATGKLVEMIPPGTGGSPPARLRMWRTAPKTTPAPTVSTPARSTPSASTVATPGPEDVEDRTVIGPPWVGRWSGPGWSTSDLFVRSCDPRSLALPESVGVARDAISAVGPNGLAVGTLAVVDGTTLDPLGFADPSTVFVSTGMPQNGTRLLAWNVRTTQLQSVTTLSANVRVSLPDLLANP